MIDLVATRAPTPTPLFARWCILQLKRGTMAVHVVTEGEHISAIAARYGFVDPQTIWSHPKNAELRQLRKNLHVLAPGDKLFILEPETKGVKRATGQLHVFVVRTERLLLRLRLLDFAGQPRRDQTGLLDVDSACFEVQSDSDGVISHEIPKNARRATLTIGDLVCPLLVGGLDPVDARYGVEDRLGNLGYDAEEDAEDRLFFLNCMRRDQGLAEVSTEAEGWAELEETHGC